MSPCVGYYSNLRILKVVEDSKRKESRCEGHNQRERSDHKGYQKIRRSRFNRRSIDVEILRGVVVLEHSTLFK